MSSQSASTSWLSRPVHTTNMKRPSPSSSAPSSSNLLKLFRAAHASPQPTQARCAAAARTAARKTRFYLGASVAARSRSQSWSCAMMPPSRILPSSVP